MDERGPSFGVGPSTSGRPPAADLLVKLATGNVHLMQGGVHPHRQHAGAVGVHVEPIFVADDGLVHIALVGLTLVVDLREIKMNITTRTNFSFVCHFVLLLLLRATGKHSPSPPAPQPG